MTVRNLSDLIIYLGFLATALAAIGAVARYMIVRPLKKWLIEQIRTPLREVHGELAPNGGSSVKDAIDRTEHAIDRTEDAMVRTESALNELRAAFLDHVVNHPPAQPPRPHWPGGSSTRR